MRYVDVILPLPLDGTYTYSVPEGMEEKVVAGMRVLVSGCTFRKAGFQL